MQQKMDHGAAIFPPIKKQLWIGACAPVCVHVSVEAFTYQINILVLLSAKDNVISPEGLIRPKVNGAANQFTVANQFITTHDSAMTNGLLASMWLQ